MIESVKLQNFRCFSELEVHGLKPINILVGENASGKSAFLEAILLSSAAIPQFALQFRLWRQLGSQVDVRSDSSSYWGLWEDLFYQYDLTNPVQIEINGAEHSHRKLIISRNSDSNQTVSLGLQNVPPPPFPL